METPLLRIREIEKAFPIRGGLLMRERGAVRALNGVSLDLHRGEALGLAGESGCGKSTLAKVIMRLLPPSRGTVELEGQAVETIDEKSYFARVQIVFQDPYSSLNPRLTVEDIISEMLQIRGVSREETARRVQASLVDVGLDASALSRYPHEFSGGQRQRIAIARALVVRPRILIADEPTSALDVSTQASILALLQDLKDKYDLTILFVSHDLRTITRFCDRVAIMYLGKIVEVLPAAGLLEDAQHPYVHALVESMPVTDPRDRRDRVPLDGEVPSPSAMPSGCAFHPRCPLVEPICRREVPALSPYDGHGHLGACHVALRRLQSE